MKKIKVLASTKQKQVLQRLNRWNKWLAGLHFLQAIAVIFLAKDVTFPISTNFITLDTLCSKAGAPSLVPATENILNVNLAYLVAAFFLMSAIAHALIATRLKTSYEKNLKNHMNKTRWVEYAFSASTMMIAIAILSGVYDMSSLVMIFGLTAVMNLCGLIMEVWNQKSKTVNWISYVVGCIAGILPWIVIAVYFWGTNVYGSGRVPTFVYFIYGSLFLFFNCFAINMYLQYTQKGKWKDYFYGERAYMILSLVAKSALAWQVFFGALRP